MTELFEEQDKSVPISQRPQQKLPTFKQLTVHREDSNDSEKTLPTADETSGTSVRRDKVIFEDERSTEGGEPSQGLDNTSLIENFVGRDTKQRNGTSIPSNFTGGAVNGLSRDKQKLVKNFRKDASVQDQADESDDFQNPLDTNQQVRGPSRAVDDFNERISEQQPAFKANPTVSRTVEAEEDQLRREGRETPPSSSIIQNAFDRMRPRRDVPEVATITIGSKTMTSVLGSSSTTKPRKDTALFPPAASKTDNDDTPRGIFSSSMRSFAAPGSQLISTVGRPQSKSHMPLHRSRNEVKDRQSTAGSSPRASVSEDESEYSGSGDDMQAESHTQDRKHESSPSPELESDRDYIDEDEKKAVEEIKIAELIRRAEDSSAVPSQDNRFRAHQILKGGGQKDFTTHLVQVINTSINRIEEQLNVLSSIIRRSPNMTRKSTSESIAKDVDGSPEERLSLTVSKADFGTMHIVGQFNLGFVLATRNNSDLFIIDQHASDEKYNFERLQATTVVQNQRLVRPRGLQLTAVEEEIVLEHNEAFLKNGFLIDADTSGDLPVGLRCKLVSLPMSREVVFDVTDLEELIALLSDSTASSSMENVPRPSKVRRMFAMRACRSSVMVGKTLTLKQMGSLVRKMGEIDKPWNCPHGRPTMRYVCGLEGWEGWTEGDGVVGLKEDPDVVDWKTWVSKMKSREYKVENRRNENEEEDGDGNEEARDEELDEDLGSDE